MIPIPLWFRPWMLKAGAIGILFIMIFFAGCRTQKGIDANKLIKQKTKIETIETNYDLCLDMVVRSEESYKDLFQSVEDANEETARLRTEYQERVLALRRTSAIAIDNINRTHRTAMQDMADQNTSLNERFLLLSASEACHEAMLEIVK